MQPVAPSPPRHQASGEFIDDNHLAVLHHVVDVALEQGMRAQALVAVMQQQDIARVVQIFDSEQLLDAGDAVLGQRHGAHLFVDSVVVFRFEAGDHAIDDVIGVGRFLGRARDDERRARLIDQDRINLVHDREVMRALDVLLEVELHVVAQVVEAELVVLAVGDIGHVGELALLVGDAVHDHADAQAQVAVDAAHPFGVAPGQVVVDRHDVDAASAERVEHGGKRGDQGLALAGLHFGDSPRVQDHPADQLDVEMALAEHALGGLAHDREDLGQDVVHAVGALLVVLDRADLGLELGDSRAQFVLALGLDLGFEAIDCLDVGSEPLDFAIVPRAEELPPNSGKS